MKQIEYKRNLFCLKSTSKGDNAGMLSFSRSTRLQVMSIDKFIFSLNTDSLLCS